MAANRGVRRMSGGMDSDLASTIGALASYARAFDEISEADGAGPAAAHWVPMTRLLSAS